VRKITLDEVKKESEKMEITELHKNWRERMS